MWKVSLEMAELQKTISQVFSVFASFSSSFVFSAWLSNATLICLVESWCSLAREAKWSDWSAIIDKLVWKNSFKYPAAEELHFSQVLVEKNPWKERWISDFWFDYLLILCIHISTAVLCLVWANNVINVIVVYLWLHWLALSCSVLLLNVVG